MLSAALDPGAALSAREPDSGVCPRPPPGSAVAEPEELRSRDGVLSVDLTLRNDKDPDGSVRYCYLAPDGAQSPTLRLKPGELLILRLRNALKPLATEAPVAGMPPGHHMDAKHADPCSSGAMSLLATNLHFHGLTLPPVCHQDDVLKTSIQPGDPTFEYRFRIPQDEPPGLYWYHPHIHGFTTRHVLGGASGALIVEGIERANADLARLPERVLVIRDQDLLNPTAPPSRSEPVVPKMLIDRDGDAANNGTGFGKPAKDLSVNFVPVPYPDYPPATLSMKPGARELWRVLNASAVTYLNLALLIADRPQPLGLVALDGVPLQSGGGSGPAVLWRDRLGVPPGARVEFIATAPPAGSSGLFVTRTVDTGQGGENDPNRALVVITASEAAAEPGLLPAATQPLPAPARQWLGDVPPVRVRKLFFSEKLSNPTDPNSATTFYLTLDGQTPAPFDPNATEPNIVVRQGEVEDWIVENRSTELHAFHIHQLHFLLLDWNGVHVDEPFLRDTVNVPYYNGHTLTYPSVRLRMDFRDPNIVGTFVYHCHLLEHEDGGMMGTIQVLPAGAPRPQPGAGATPKK
ncbi:MAG TPA: multicopper oxidase domain-containing protein [Steroidobacteraceae bacterium]|jgi:FtsP/CotA-like multicopper oxidase with cupredoxin domain|nr:multicopper oxidase domain-containing protein [Steroidobacteraceae bacterium]